MGSCVGLDRRLHAYANPYSRDKFNYHTNSDNLGGSCNSNGVSNAAIGPHVAWCFAVTRQVYFDGTPKPAWDMLRISVKVIT